MRTRKVYRKRRIAVINALTMHFPDQVHIHGDATGLHLVAEFPGKEFTEKALEDLKHAGVRIYPVEIHTIRKGYHRHKVIIGYGNLTIEEIEEGVRRIKTVWA